MTDRPRMTQEKLAGLVNKLRWWATDEVPGLYVAGTPFGEYRVNKAVHSGLYYVRFNGLKHGFDDYYPTLEAAKAAAQADYAARIAAALDGDAIARIMAIVFQWLAKQVDPRNLSVGLSPRSFQRLGPGCRPAMRRSADRAFFSRRLCFFSCIAVGHCPYSAHSQGAARPAR